MENQNEEQKGKTPDNEHYDVNNPQNLTHPQYNSTSTHREGSKLPTVENLNQIKDENILSNEKNSYNSGTQVPQNDDSLHGKDTKTDLGEGQKDDDEDKDERIISR